MGEKFKQLKDENKILVMLAFYSIAIGMWGNFRQLWMQDNNYAVTQISSILGVATFLCVFLIIVFMKTIRLNRIKAFICTNLLIKILALCALLLLNQTDNKIGISLFIIIDIITEKLIIISIYPLLITIKKDDILYSKRKLVEYIFKDVGILIAGIFIGRTIANLLVNYNFFLWISVLFLTMAMYLLFLIKQKKVEEDKPKHFMKYFLGDKLIWLYTICYFVGNIAINIGIGLKMLMVTNQFGFSAGQATNYFLIIGLLADGIGILALKYLTPKNDYLTITIKFGIRFTGYVIAFFCNHFIVSIIALTWSILISTAYENIIDAPYINRVKNEYQLIFTYTRYLVGILGESIGLFLAGWMYQYGVNYMFGLSAFFMIFQIAISYRLIYLRRLNKEKNRIEERVEEVI